MASNDFKKYLIQFLFQHPELIELKSQEDYCINFYNRIDFNLNQVKEYLNKDFEKKSYCLLNITSQSKMFKTIIQFLKIIGNKLGNSFVPFSITNVNNFFKKIDQTIEIFKQYKIKKLIIFKIMENKKTNEIVGIIGLPCIDGTWLFLNMNILTIIIITQLFKFLKGEKKINE